MNQKKIRLRLAAAFLILTLGAKAQRTDSTSTPEARATALTEKMKTQLALTDDQVPQVQAINLKYVEKNQEILAGTEGRFAKFRAFKSSQKAKDKELKAILDKDQYKKYEAMKEQMKNQVRQQYQNKGAS
ncbi:MAG TPA: hypothetical protein VG605_17040 [Puia sp.]|nr:hypothetical protein [Puia sp.]